MALGYCNNCFMEHTLNGTNVPPCGPCLRCGKPDGVIYSNDIPFTAYCHKCYAEHKTHQFVNMPYKCNNCGQPDALKWMKG